MSHVHHILIPELVPLENKGEEAIVRGIADVVFPDGNYELHLFDEINEYRFHDGIHVYPVKWFISLWLTREFGLGLTIEKMRDSMQSLCRNVLHKAYPKWVKKKDRVLLKTIKEIENIKLNGTASKEYQGLENILDLDYIIAGHDGAMNERVAHVIEKFRENMGIPLGVFGIEFPQVFKSKAIVDEQHRVLKDSLFCYCRTQASKEVVDRNFPLIEAEVKPDPAFGMVPASSEEVDQYLEGKNLLHLFEKDVIVCTTCETGPISRYCFEDETTPAGRLNAHRAFYASLLEHVLDKNDVNILFLPHALGPGQALDDTIVAADVMGRVKENTARVFLLKDDIPAKLLKGIIRKSQFLIAERIHSMIGAVGVSTPFLCLGSKTDRRVEGIIGQMVGASNSIFYMNTPALEEGNLKFDALWKTKAEEEKRLKQVSASFAGVHQVAANTIRKAFEIE